MAKRIHELATELGMRTERLLALLEREGFEVQSALDEIDAQAAEEIRRGVEANRSSWDRLKTLLRRRTGSFPLPAKVTLREEEEEELEQLVSRQEIQERPVPLELDLDDESDAEPERPVPRDKAFTLAQKGPERRAGEPETGVSRPEPAEEPVEPAMAPVEEPTEVDIEQPVAKSELPAGDGQEALEEESLLATLDRIAQMEETQALSRSEPISADAPLERQLSEPEVGETVDSEQPAPVEEAAMPETVEGEPSPPKPAEVSEPLPGSAEEPFAVAPPTDAAREPVLEEIPQAPLESPVVQAGATPDFERIPGAAEEDLVSGVPRGGDTASADTATFEEALLSADELLERQLAGMDTGSEMEESPPPASIMEEVAEDTGEAGLSEAVQEEVPEETEDALREPVAAESVPERLAEERRAGTTPSRQEPTGTVTIDELLGTSSEVEEGVAPSKRAAGEQVATAQAAEGELLDTKSLLGLEFTEQPPSERESAPRVEVDKGVGVEELLGVSEGPEESAVKRPSLALQRLQRLLREISGILRRPGPFLQGLSNVEIIIVSATFLLTLSGVFYAFYRWYNFNRSGMDERFFQWAEQLRKVGHYQEAIGKYQMVLDYHPDSDLVEPTYFGLADARYRLEQFREAIPAYEKALALHEQSGGVQGLSIEGFPEFLVVPQARFNLTRCLLQVGFYERAKANLVELARQFPGEEIGEESRLILGDLYTHWARQENRPEKYRNAIAEYRLALGEFPASRRRVELTSRLGDAYRALYDAQPAEEKEPALLQEAVAEYENAAKLALEENRPQDEVGRLRVAWADTQRALGATRSAIQAYDRLLGTGLPMDLQVEVLEKIARSYLALEDFKQAERWAQELIDHNPEDSGLALAYYIFGDAEWERKQYRDYTKMMQAYQKALQLDEHSGPDAAHSQRAYMRMTYVLYRMNNNLEEAAETYRAIIEKYPDGPYTYRAKFFLAECLQGLGRYLEAADAYRRVVEDYATTEYVSPTYYRDALYREGDCLLAGGQQAEAVRAYQFVLKELGFPDTPEGIAVREHLADAYIGLENYPQAEKVLANLREKYPQSDHDGHVSLKLAEVRESLFDYEGAREMYLALLQQGRHAETVQKALFRLGASYMTQLQGAEPREAEALQMAAISTYEGLLRRFPEAKQAELEMGKLYRDLGDPARSAQCLERFLKRASAEDPQVEATVLLGEIAWEQGRLDEAVKHFRLVEQLPVVPGDESWRAQGHYRLAECLRQQQNLAEAKARYEKVLADFPDSRWAEESKWKLGNVDWQIEVSQVGASASL